jgi:opacity protein-like surface antigen
MMETTMFRKLSLAAVAAVALGGAALAPTPAAAWYGGYHHGWNGAYHYGWWGPRVYFGAPVSYGYGNCYVRELLQTPWGPRWRLVNRCY